MWSKVQGKLNCVSAALILVFHPTENMEHLILLHLHRGYLNSLNTDNEVMACTGTSAVVHHEAKSYLSCSNFFMFSHPCSFAMYCSLIEILFIYLILHMKHKYNECLT